MSRTKRDPTMPRPSLQVDYCTKTCTRRGLCVERSRSLPSAEWCRGCKVQLFCILAQDDVVHLKVVQCPHCNYPNSWLFPKCLCNGASSTGRLSFPCSYCHQMAFYLGTAKWKNR